MKDVLKKRLKNYYKRKNLTNARVNSSSPTKPRHSHYLVIDFEATCDRETLKYPHEIIEFPIVLVDTVNRVVVSSSLRSVITETCKRLFKITTQKRSFIHYGDLYSASSRLLLRSAPDPCTAKKKSFEARVECVRKNPGEQSLHQRKPILL